MDLSHLHSQPVCCGPPHSYPPPLNILHLAIKSSIPIYPPQTLLFPVKAVRPCSMRQLSKISGFPGTSWTLISNSGICSISVHFLAAAYHSSMVSLSFH